MARITNLTDNLAKRLWSGDVVEGRGSDGVGNLTGGPLSYRKQFPISKQEEGIRRGAVPSHINNPQSGQARPFNPFTLRGLADTEPVQVVTNTIIKDIRSIPMEVVPLDDAAEPPQEVIEEAERAMQDPNPNPEKLTDLNEMFLRDAMEVGNSAGIINLMVDDRRAEVIPMDPNTFTVEWDKHRILQTFYQYPSSTGASRFGNPVEIEPEQVMWGVANPETQRAGFYGHSPVEKVKQAINVLGGLVESEVKELEEGMPPGIITLVGDHWDSDDYEHFETYWENNVKGEQHKAPYTRGEANFVPFNHSYQELQILERQTWYHKLVGAAFNVPVSESGIQVGDTNRATDVSVRQKYKQNAVRPWLEYLEDIWTYQYLHRYWSEEVRARFDPGMDLLERKELANIHSTRLQSGVMTINEVRQEMGKEPVEWGDEPFDLKAHVRSQGGGLLGGMGGGGTSSEVPSGSEDVGDQQTPTEEQGQALEEGTTQEVDELEQSGDGTDFRDTSLVGKPFGPWEDFDACVQHFLDQGDDRETAERKCGELEEELKQKTGETWLAGLLVEKDEPLRETEDHQGFEFQPSDIEALRQDLEDVFGDTIEGVINQVKGRQELLRDKSTEESDTTDFVDKSVTEFLKIIQDEVGMEFAEDVAAVLTEHKMEQVLAGEDNILDELAAAGISRGDVAVDQIRDRVTSRIQKRTLKVTKPVSQRLEDDLRDTLEEGWQKGHSIEDIERNIEEVTDKWQGQDAERLARDQIGKASKEGRMEYAAETEEKVGGWLKTWLATPDSRTRDSHRRMDETTVPRDEPFVVNYTYDGGPATVEEDYPGESVYGIQCRCDISLSPRNKVAEAREWREDVSQQMAKRIQEVEEEHGAPLPDLLVALETDPDISRKGAASHLGVSKRTYYKWGKQAGLIDH